MIAKVLKMLKNTITLMFAAFLVYGCSDLDKVSSPPNSIKKVIRLFARKAAGIICRKPK